MKPRQQQLNISLTPHESCHDEFFTLQVSKHMPGSNPMNLLRFSHVLTQSIHCKHILSLIFRRYNMELINLLKMFTTKHISTPILTKYIREPINYLCKEESNISKSKSTSNVRFGTHRSGHGFAIQNIKSLQNLHCVLPLPKDDFKPFQTLRPKM